MYVIGAPLPLGGWELAIILVIVLVLFGPKQLPKLGKMFGETMKEVRAGVDEANKGLDGASETSAPAPAEAAAPAPVEAPAPAAAPAPAPETKAS